MTRRLAFNWLTTAAVLVLVGFAPVTAMAWFEVEDFEAGDVGGFDNPFFLHAPGLDEFGQEPSFLWNFDLGSSISPKHSLSLTPATDYITFRLEDGQKVTGAEVWMRSAVLVGPTIFHVIGVDADGRPLEHSVDTPDDETWNDWHHVSTHGVPFAEITEIRLTGIAKGQFDDLMVAVIPEPATLGLLGLGFFGLAWSRRRQTPR